MVRISTSDGFGAEFVTPALVRLQQRHPMLNVEMLSATRKVSQNRSGVDLEVVVGRTDVSNAQTIFLTNYFLRLYASPAYAAARGLPETPDGVGQHGFVSYVESALQVAELGHRSSQLPMPKSSFQATSIFAQVEAVRRGAGIGLLPNFMVAGQPGVRSGAPRRLPAPGAHLGGGPAGIAAVRPGAGRDCGPQRGSGGPPGPAGSLGRDVLALRTHGRRFRRGRAASPPAPRRARRGLR